MKLNNQVQKLATFHLKHQVDIHQLFQQRDLRKVQHNHQPSDPLDHQQKARPLHQQRIQRNHQPQVLLPHLRGIQHYHHQLRIHQV